MLPTLSITIPTYNRAHLLKEALRKLTLQIDKFSLHQDIEIVISDNASSDNTAEVVNAFDAKKYNIIYNRNEKNLGVIQNILKLVEFSTGKFWMFYGDDDEVYDDVLSDLVTLHKHKNEFPAFMFRQHNGLADRLSWHAESDKALSLLETAKDYFYYIGNAGIFSVNTELAKEAVKNYKADLLNTCWPQTNILFIAAQLSGQNKQVYASHLKAAQYPYSPLVINNSYYMFETMIFAQVRSAVAIGKAAGDVFTKEAVQSIHKAIYNPKFYYELLENYLFLDSEAEKKDFITALKNYEAQIAPAYKQVFKGLSAILTTPVPLLKIKLYSLYYNDTKKLASVKQLPFISRLKNLSYPGFLSMIKTRVEQKRIIKSQKNKNVISANGDYF